MMKSVFKLGAIASLTAITFHGLIPAASLAHPNHSPSIGNPQTRDPGRHFRELGIEGSILIENLEGDRILQHNPQRNATPFPTASTFKIFNSLVALETGAIANDLAILTWDGIPRELSTWNRDLNLREAFRTSAVWFYQILARRAGHAPMQQWITAANYGNQTIGGPDEIDRFWLNGTLQITPQEQIDFLRRLYQDELPFSARSQTLVKDIMIAEKTPTYTIRAKTGWYGFGNDAVQNIGWYVGYLETAETVYFFALNIDINRPADGAARLELTRRTFHDLGVL
ncbi:class D beta-lactamase [Spirulina major CS-329]|nr:class D beta-lactamase [Spirulina subsalsa CS-330]MDB9504588.1 class D beta-lactamase [Spirulina major CS-329]